MAVDIWHVHRRLLHHRHHRDRATFALAELARTLAHINTFGILGLIVWGALGNPTQTIAGWLWPHSPAPWEGVDAYYYPTRAIRRPPSTIETWVALPNAEPGPAPPPRNRTIRIWSGATTTAASGT
jgi:hypothetical protein